MQKKSIILVVLGILLVPMIAYASSTVNITTIGNFYNVTSGDNSSLNNPWFSASFRNDNVPSISHAVGGLSEYSIFGTFFPRRTADGDTTPNENVGLANSTHFATSDTALTNANMSIVERGPVRVMLQATNRTSNTCNGFIENSCINWTSESYSYPRQIFIFNTFSGNYTNMSFSQWEALEQELAFQFNYSTNLSLEGVVNHTYILGFTAGQSRRGNSRESLNMFFNTTGNNRTLLIFPSRFLNSSNDVRWKINIPASAPTSVITFYLGNNVISNADITERAVEFGYGILFGRNGARAETESATVYGLDFNESYRAFRNPATITTSIGTYEGRYNVSGTYNFTNSNPSNVIRFNLTTGTNNYTYPVFHVKNMATGNAVDHIYFRNLSFGNLSWTRLINGTNFLIQAGNDSFYGYNYTLFMPNATLGNGTSQNYEYWLSNSTDPITFNATGVFDEHTLLPITPFNITLFNGNYLEQGINVSYFNSTMSGQTEITINATGYHQRRYYTNLTSGIIFNLTGYLVADTIGNDITYMIYSSRAPFGENTARIHVYKFINGNYQVVSEQISDMEGKGVIWLDTSAIYKINAESADGTLTGNISAYTPQPSILLRINLGGESTSAPLPGYWDYYKQINGACSVDNTTRTLNCSWADTSGRMSSLTLNVEALNNTNQWTICSNTSASASGIFICNFGTPNNQTFLWTMQAFFNDPEPMQLASGSWIDYILPVVLGLTGIIIALLIVMFSGFIGVQLGSPVMTIIMTLIGVGASTLLGFLSFGYATLTILIGLFIAGIVLVYKIGR